jgi:phage FluMu protein Com
MRFRCNHCNQKIHANHYWSGMSVTCPSCGRTTELKYRAGQEIPNTEYSISFSEFKQLFHETNLEAIYPIVEKILKCWVERSEVGIKLVATDGSLIPLEVAHFEIQMNSESQYKIYNAAMTQRH